MRFSAYSNKRSYLQTPPSRDLSRDVPATDLCRFFEPFGKTSEVNLAKDESPGASRGFRLLEMSLREEAKAAISGLSRQPL